MSKSISGLFHGTSGYVVVEVNKLQLSSHPETTSVVWKHIKSTQYNYAGTIIPKSFEVDVPVTEQTPSGKMWTHGNATEHIYEAISSTHDYPQIKNGNPKLYTQFILYDYYKTLGNAVRNGVKYEKLIKSGNWEFIFSKPRKAQDYTVVNHSKFNGI